MIDVAVTSLVISFGWLLVLLSRRVWNDAEWDLVRGGFLVTQVASAAFLFVAHNVYSGADFDLFHAYGLDVAAEVRANPSTVLQVIFLVLQRDHFLGTWVPLSGGSTGTMIGFVALAHLITQDSLWATSFLFSQVAFFGRLILLATLRRHFPDRDRQALAFACLFVPSVVWWSAGIVKEAITLFGLSLFVAGSAGALDRRSTLRSLATMAIGAEIILLLKAYVLLAAGVALGTYWYWRGVSRRSSFNPVSLVVGLGTAYAAILVVGSLVPRFSSENLLDETVRMQEAGNSLSGGSNYLLASGSTASLRTQALLAPIAVFTGLFRPGLWEARNPMMAVNGLETTAFLWTFLQVTLRQRTRGLSTYFRSHPMAMFAAVFVVLLGAGTGLASANLGTLSRYRVPMMPFFAVVLLTLQRHPTPAPARAEAGMAPAR